MSKVSITRSLLDNLATSISMKSGEPVPMTLTEMKTAVDSISVGGGGGTLTDTYDSSTKTLTLGLSSGSLTDTYDSTTKTLTLSM